MSFTYDVAVAGRRPYHEVVTDRIRSTIDIRRELIAEGHPDDIEVRIRKNTDRRA